MPAQKVLIVEDEELMRSILRRLLEGDGYEVFTADSAERALEVFAEQKIDVTLTDIRMSGMDGITMLDHLKTLDPDALVVVMTAYSSVDTAVAALRNGAFDYLTKPFVNEELRQTVGNAIKMRALFRENRALRRELKSRASSPIVIGSSDAIQSVLRLIQKIAATNAAVLIRGESGTGKELIAKVIHRSSDRAERPFLAVNCGALPESLLESELFGHVKGAFTGAISEKKGLFRSADGGTIFLDEIGEMQQPLQVKLLRALQEQEVTPLGSSFPIKFDARIIAATNRDLDADVAANRFRADLYYRLNVIELDLPPLRQRLDDIEPLVRYFMQNCSSNNNLPQKSVTVDAMAALKQYEWPGNVRELENAVARAFVLSGDEIDIGSLPPKIRQANLSSVGATEDIYLTLEETERRYITEVMARTNNDKAAAAKILDIDLSTLYRKLKRFET